MLVLRLLHVSKRSPWSYGNENYYCIDVSQRDHFACAKDFFEQQIKINLSRMCTAKQIEQLPNHDV